MSTSPNPTPAIVGNSKTPLFAYRICYWCECGAADCTEHAGRRQLSEPLHFFDALAAENFLRAMAGPQVKTELVLDRRALRHWFLTPASAGGPLRYRWLATNRGPLKLADGYVPAKIADIAPAAETLLDKPAVAPQPLIERRAPEGRPKSKMALFIACLLIVTNLANLSSLAVNRQFLVERRDRWLAAIGIVIAGIGLVASLICLGFAVGDLVLGGGPK